MEFESSLHLAERLGINVRTVQLWAKNGKLPGAYKHGRDWMIPKTVSEYLEVSPELAQMCEPLPLMTSAYEVGKAKEFVDSIESKEARLIALSEYYYFSGDVEKACETVENYIRECDGVINASVWIVYGFSCMTLGRTRLAKVVTESVTKSVTYLMDTDIPDVIKATCAFLAKTSRVIITSQNIDIPLKEYIKHLAGGFKAFSCFTLAQEACFKGQFGRASGMAEMGLALMDARYPLAEIHLELVSAMSHLGLKEVAKASNHLLKAWEMAQADGFYQPFVEHFSSIQAILKNCVEDSYPEEYKKVSEMSAVFSSSRRRISRRDDYDEISKPLTSEELAVAVLLNAGVSNADIAHGLHCTVSKVKTQTLELCKKLGVNNKKDLLKFFER